MKFAPFLAVVIATGALVGWFAPGNSGPATTGEETTPDSPDRLAVLSQDRWLAGEVVLEREVDGHFYADVAVGGASAHMLVDTGASVVALTGEDADSLGVGWDPGAVRPVARGASGDVYGVPVTIARMQLGDIEVERVRAIVVPEGLPLSLLGQSFLSQVGRVEMDGERMVMGG